jgi:hypothetical protein
VYPLPGARSVADRQHLGEAALRAGVLPEELDDADAGRKIDLGLAPDVVAARADAGRGQDFPLARRMRISGSCRTTVAGIASADLG